MPRKLSVLAGFLSLSLVYLASAQKTPVPHGQDSPPGPALTPAEAVKKMKVPEGFTVEIVAAEPDIINRIVRAPAERAVCTSSGAASHDAISR